MSVADVKAIGEKLIFQLKASKCNIHIMLRLETIISKPAPVVVSPREDNRRTRLQKVSLTHYSFNNIASNG
jgi:hypothetical protein